MIRHILVVDDEIHVRRLVEVNLQRAGCRVSTAKDGVEALAKARAEPPDLIVADVMMPHLDGIELLKQLKSDPGLAHVPVILLTARSQDEDVFRGWQSGAAMYLTKPFSPLELLDLVHRMFRDGDDDDDGSSPPPAG